MAAIESLLISIIPWLFVLLLVLYYHVFKQANISHIERSYHSYLSDKLLLERRKPATDAFRLPSSSSKEARLPEIPSSIGRQSSSSGSIRTSAMSTSSVVSSSIVKVFFDWPSDARDLGYLNYKSFESYLVRSYQPNQRIEINILLGSSTRGYGLASVIR
jgi:hypothetical protein